MLASLAQLLDNSNNSNSAVVVVDLHSGKMVAGGAVTQLEGSREVGGVNIIIMCSSASPSTGDWQQTAAVGVGGDCCRYCRYVTCRGL